MSSPRLAFRAGLGAVALALPTLAAASCYSIYDAKNRLAFQSTVAPVDLSMRIGDAMRARYPGGFLIMSPDETDCRDVRTGGTVAPRFDPGLAQTTPANEVLQASPLLRSSAPAGNYLDSPALGGDLQVREVVPGGNVLSIRRAPQR